MTVHRAFTVHTVQSIKGGVAVHSSCPYAATQRMSIMQVHAEMREAATQLQLHRRMFAKAPSWVMGLPFLIHSLHGCYSGSGLS